MRVAPGRYDVHFTYRRPAWKKALFALTSSMFIGGLTAPLWRRFRGTRAALTLLALVSLAGCRREANDPAKVIDLLADPRALRVAVAPGSGAETVLPVPAEERSWDFENDDRTWKIRGYRGKVHGGASDEIAHGGKRSFCIASTSGPVDADARVNIDVRPSTDYRLEGRVRTFDLEPTTATVYGSLYLGEFSYTRAPRDDFNDPTVWHRDLPKLHGSSAGWELLRYDLRTRADTRMLRIGLSLGNWGEASGRVCVDDVRLTEVREKPGFASALGPDGVPLVEHLVSGNELRRAVHAYPSAEYRYALTVPPKARLDFAIGIEDRGIADDGDGVRFEVEVAEAGQSRTLFARHLDAGRPARQRGWFDVELPLDAYAGRRVELVFRTAASAPGAAATSFRGDVAAWANPVVYAARDPVERRREPNVFLISVDTLRADHLRAYGYDRDTSPAIDALAAEAVLFENAFTTMPRTTPALASMMTGLHPRAHGLITLLHALPAERVTLAERLGELGYATGAVVTHNTSRESGLQQGFDTFADHHRIWVNEPRATAEHLVGEAARWVSDHRDRKMFFWLHLWDPHFYYIPPRPYDRWFDPSGAGPVDLYERLRRRAITAGQAHFAPGLDAAQQRQMIALYDGEIRYTDGWVGSFLEHLKELGLYEDALIVFTSDHGESLGEHEYWYEHGEYLYDGTLRIPLIVKFPRDRAKGGSRIAGKTTILDVMPTILAVAGGAAGDVAGVDLALALDGAREPHPLVYAETDRVFFPENPRRYIEGIAGNWKSARDGRYKLIEIPHPNGNLYELYDTIVDPEEKTNLYRGGNPDAERLTAALRQWLASFDAGEAASSKPLEIDESTAERLRRLGYMNE